jgi:hypothetical protein
VLSPRIYFRVYTADQAKQLDVSGAFTGEGTAVVVECNTGVCPIGDLSWQGVLPVGGTYYVQVYNSNPNPLTFRFFNEGTNVTFGR